MNKSVNPQFEFEQFILSFISFIKYLEFNSVQSIVLKCQCAITRCNESIAMSALWPFMIIGVLNTHCSITTQMFIQPVCIAQKSFYIEKNDFWPGVFQISNFKKKIYKNLKL